MTDIAGYAYGLTVFAGGLIGYIKGKYWAAALRENLPLISIKYLQQKAQCRF